MATILTATKLIRLRARAGLVRAPTALVNTASGLAKAQLAPSAEPLTQSTDGRMATVATLQKGKKLAQRKQEST